MCTIRGQADGGIPEARERVGENALMVNKSLNQKGNWDGAYVPSAVRRTEASRGPGNASVQTLCTNISHRIKREIAMVYVNHPRSGGRRHPGGQGTRRHRRSVRTSVIKSKGKLRWCICTFRGQADGSIPGARERVGADALYEHQS